MALTNKETIGNFLYPSNVSYERFYPKSTRLEKYYDDYRHIGNASVHLHNRRHRKTRKSETPINVGCLQPSTSISIDYTGRCFTCSCPAWVPYPIGNILDFETFEEVWDHPIAKKIQANAEPGASYKFCNTVVCGVEHTESYQHVFHEDIDIQQVLPGAGPNGQDIRIKDIKPLGPAIPNGYHTPDDIHRINPYFINVAIDESCNLQCATCRTSMIHHNNKGKVYDYKKELANHICKLLDRFEKNTMVQIGGDGEIFSSKVYSDIIYNYVPRHNHRFLLKTNGTLITSRIKESQIMQQLDGFTISIDAGSKAVYEKVRNPAKWNALIKSLDLLTPLSKNNKDSDFGYNTFSLNFVLHRENMHDIINFMDLCEHYNACGTVQAIQNWGTYGDSPAHGPSIPSRFFEHRVHYKGDVHYDEWAWIANKVRQHKYYFNVTIENEILTQL